MVRPHYISPTFSLLTRVWLSFVLLWSTVDARELLRGGPSPAGARPAIPAGGGTTTPVSTAPAVDSPAVRLSKTKDALKAVRLMQQQARDLAKGSNGPNGLNGLTPVDPKSWNLKNGLRPSTSLAWTGAAKPVGPDGKPLPDGSADVTIVQTEQQALLHWETFNIGKDTTLNFDQSKGGANVGQWIAFNKIGVTGSPSQILGKINTIGGPADEKGNVPVGGQVYVINPNGIIFGGSSVVNTHGLVASSLPINENLIQRGVLNNPDGQFLFSALPQAAGKNEMPAFTPTMVDEYVYANDRTLTLKPAVGLSPNVTIISGSTDPLTLTADTDYTLVPDGSSGKMKVSFTTEGRGKIPTGTAVVQVAYTPAGDQYGNVEVQAGAQLKAPTNADRVGGRVALIGPNVANAGTISTPNGQTIFAAGLQVGFEASKDPSLRGLNVYVGAVADPALNVTDADGKVTGNTGASAGTVINGTDFAAHVTAAAIAYAKADGSTGTVPVGTAITGLIDGSRDGTADSVADAAVTIVGKTVNQMGAIDVTTSGSLNGRVDLLAEYNAVTNLNTATIADKPLFLRQATANDISTGTVTLGAGSVTRILPELSSKEKVLGTELILPSQVNLRGRAIHLASAGTGSDGATLVAPNGKVAMDAGAWLRTTNFTEDFRHTEGQIYFDAGTAVDVAGSQGVQASVTENIVAVELRGPQLADSPLQREGALRGQTVQVDLRKIGTYNGRAWVGTPLADASGYVGLVQRTVGQLTTAGGSVKLSAGSSIVVNKQATIDVSGGWTDYQGGLVKTSKVMADGHIYDIAQATPDRVYTGVYTGSTTTTDPKWGTTTTSSDPLLQGTQENGYRQGGNGGSLQITAPAMVLDGRLQGQTVAGTQQRSTAGQLAKTFANPTPSQTAILPAIQAALARPNSSTLAMTFEQEFLYTDRVLQRSPTAPKIIFASGAPVPTPAAPAPFPAANSVEPFASLGQRGLKDAVLTLSPDLVSTDPTHGNGFGSLTVNNSDGDIRVASKLETAPGGSLALEAANLYIEKDQSVTAPGGSLSFIAHNVSPYTRMLDVASGNSALPAPAPARGLFSLGSGSTLSTAGLVVDNRLGQAGAGVDPFMINGYRVDPSTGNEFDAVSVRAYKVDLANDSTIDVSGGVNVGATGKMTYGNAGKISLLAVLDPLGATNLLVGQDPNDPANTQALRGYLHFNPEKAKFKGYAGPGGRSGGLTLQAQLIQIGNPSAPVDPKELSPANLDPANTLFLAPDFFNRGGLGSYSLIGLGETARGAEGSFLTDPLSPGRLFVPGVYIAPDTVIAPTARSWLATIPSVAGGKVVLQEDAQLLPLGLRNPVSLDFKATGLYDLGFADPLLARGDLKLGSGASIRVDPKGSVSLSGDTVQVDGEVKAPAGTITIKGADAYKFSADIVPPEEALPTVVLGAESHLSAVGAYYGPVGTAPNPGILGNANTGSVLAGGKISVQGNIVAEANAVLDVSGTAHSLDLLPGYSGGAGLLGLVTTPVASDGGTINLKGEKLLVSSATLLGAAGGTSAQGGTMTVSSGSFLKTGVQATPVDINLEVTQEGSVLKTGIPILGRSVLDKDNKAIASLGHFAASDFWDPNTRTTAGGFDSLVLEGNIRFAGPVQLGAERSLTVGTGGVIYSVAQGTEPDQTVVLQAPHVALGRPFQPPVPTGIGSIAPNSIFKQDNAPFYLAPKAGPGELQIKADSLISLGSLSLQGISAASFSTEVRGKAVAGDIRGNGTLNIAGTLDFTAGQVYPTTGSSFTVAAYDHTTVDAAGDEVVHQGSVTFKPVLDTAAAPVLPALPLSAGGELTVYASRITQGGTLRAPLGTINLGWNGVGTPPTQVNGAPADLLVGFGTPPATTENLTLTKSSVTSVSGVDPTTGLPVTFPYGYSPDGTKWFDPSGTDITVTGPPRKAVALSAVDLIDQKGSLIDIGGGGDLYAYRWIDGVGGTKDILAPGYVPNPSSPGMQSFAVLPGYQAGFAPYAPFGAAAAETGYVGNSTLTLGDTVHLDLNNGEGAKDYTLLPARYALLPGAYLVTPVAGAPFSAPQAQANGTTIVAGYRNNSFDALQGSPIRSAFEVALGTAVPSTAPNPPKSIVRQRAQYGDFQAKTFFPKSANTANVPVWRLPVDAGYLLLTAAGGGTIRFDGDIKAKSLVAGEGRGGVVDINSPSDILIDSSQASDSDIAAVVSEHGLTDPLILDAATLNNFGSESLLIGGYRTSGATGTAVTVSTSKLAVSNAGETLQGSDVILVANNSLQVDTNASIAPSGTLTGADDLAFGRLDSSGTPVAGSGNGVVLRVSSDATAQISRIGADQSTSTSLTIDKGAQLGGTTGSLTLDSTNKTLLDPEATLRGSSIALGSGQISLQFAGAGDLRTQANEEITEGLILSKTAIEKLQASAKALSLRSYTSIDLYGSGELGNASVAQIALHTPEIFGDGGDVTFRAKAVSLDNDSKSAPADLNATPPTTGTLKFAADTFRFGTGDVAVNHYAALAVDAANRVTVDGTGSLATQGDLTVTTPFVTGTTAADQKITAAGALTIAGTTDTQKGDGLGAKLTLEGSEISLGSRIQLASGTVAVRATGSGSESDVAVTGTIDVSGRVQKFFDVPKYTNGGQVSLISDHGDATVTETGVVNVSGAGTDPADKANVGLAYASAAGSLSVGALQGIFAAEGKLEGHGITSRQGGSFSLDAGTIPLDGGAPSLAPLEEALALGGYTQSQNIRVRHGDVVVDDLVTAHAFSLSTDQGSIAVTGTGSVDASGETGGTITLAARGSVTVDSGALLTVKADDFNAAGKGGAVRLEAGAPQFNSAGTYLPPSQTAAVDLRGTVDLSIGRESVDLPLNGTVHFPQGSAGSQVKFSEAGSYFGADGKPVKFAAGATVTLTAGAAVELDKAGSASFAGDGKGGSIPMVFPDGRTVQLKPASGSAGATAAKTANAAAGKNTGTLYLRAPQLDAAGVPLLADNAGTAGTILAVKPVSGAIIDPSSIVVEGYKVFVPVAGSIDTVKTNVAANGQAFVNQTASTLGNLFSGAVDPAVLHLRAGAEIVNAAPLGTTAVTITAGTTNSTIAVVAGGSFTLDSLTAATAKIASTDSSGRIILPDGTSSVLNKSDKNVVLAAGSTVVLDNAGTVALTLTKTGSGTGSGHFALAEGTVVNGTNAVSFNAGSGTNLKLNTAGTSAVSVAAATPVVLLIGGQMRFSSDASVTSSNGAIVNYSASTTANRTVAAGSTITLKSAGTITFASGAAPVVALSGGNYQTAGSTTITTSRGDLALTNDWNLAANHFTPVGSTGVGEPQMLTLRAAGNLVFNGALSDGFVDNSYTSALLGDGSLSSSYRLVAGADFSAADFHRVQPLSALGLATGSLQLGQIGVGSTTSGSNALTRNFVNGRFQVIRTGTGDIEIATGRDVLLLNPFATIYTAGRRTYDPTLSGTFDVPVLNQNFTGTPLGSPQQTTSSPVQYSLNGGDIAIAAQGDIAHKTKDNFGYLQEDSEQQVPTNWLYRRGLVDPETGAFFQGAVDGSTKKLVRSDTGEVMSTTWWVDFSNFFEGIGALGGGNVTLTAGRDIMNVDALVPTNARMTGKDSKGVPLAPDAANLVELGGGDLVVRAGRDINGGVYYVEKGQGSLEAGRNVLTNLKRTYAKNTPAITELWLPTTLFLGKGGFTVSAYSDLRLGPVANPFLLPAGINNTPWAKSYFSTFDPGNTVDVTSLTGSVRLTENSSTNPVLYAWYNSVLLFGLSGSAASNDANSKPWLRLAENNLTAFRTATALAPATLKVVTYSGDLNLVGNLVLAPSPQGTIDFAVAGSISALNPINLKSWGYGTIRLLDSDPGSIPGIANPLATVEWSVPNVTANPVPTPIYAGIDGLFTESEKLGNDSLQTKLSRHAAGPLHADDPTPARIYATDGDISGFSLLAGKPARILASDDISDISLSLQNNRASDISVIAAGRDLLAFAPNTPRRQAALAETFSPNTGRSGQIEIGGPGTLEVLAGRNLDLGVDTTNAALGITSIGSARNPNLPFGGADVVAAAGVGEIYTPAAAQQLQSPGLLSTKLDFSTFLKSFLKAGKIADRRYLPLLGAALGLPVNTPEDEIASAVASGELTERKALALLDIFYLVLRNAARDRNDPDSPDAGTYTKGFDAIAALFPGSPKPTEEDLKSTVPVVRPAGPWTGNLSMSRKEIKTAQGGKISLVIPGGDLTVGKADDPQKSDQGILTERGGGISIFAADNVNVGTSRIFTLRGGDEILWSTWGNIAAGSGSKTVFSAPPTRVLIDPQSGDVQNDLAGLATGAGIGVLATLAGVKPGDVDLIAPVGTIDAGDAGIRSAGNLNIAARVVLNAGNIQVGGASAGTPPPIAPPSPPSLPPPPAVSNEKSENSEVEKQKEREKKAAESPSIIMVEVLGYGGGDDDVGTNLTSDEEKTKEEEEEAKKKNAAEAAAEAVPASP